MKDNECSEYYHILEKMGMRMIENNQDKMKEIIDFVSKLAEELGEFETKHNIK